MSYAYKKTVIQELVETIKAAGFRAFVAESGTHGFFTDEVGDRLITFQVDCFSPNFGGNYCRRDFRTGQSFGSKRHGTGWRIETSQPEDENDFKRLLNTPVPPWAKEDGVSFRHRTVAEHLAFFGGSSKYTEF